MKNRSRLFYTFAIYLIMALSELCIGICFTFITEMNLNETQSNPYTFMLCTLTSKFLAYILLTIIKKDSVFTDSEIFKKSFLMIFSLPLASLVILILFLMCCYKIDDTGFRLTLLISSIVLVLTNIAVFGIIRRQNDLIETKERLFFAEKHISSQTGHYEELYKYQNELRIFRHDIKNKLISLIGMLEQNETEKAIRVMKENLNWLDNKNKQIVNSGNPIIDAILQSKMHEAEQSEIKITVNSRLTEEIKVDGLELGIVLGNALDNAIEASSKAPRDNRKISVRLLSSSDRISIQIQNSVNEDVDPSDLKTSKEDKINHGHGISSIKAICSKYDGIINLECENRIFSVNINIANKLPLKE